MPPSTLRDRCVLVVEDEYLLAEDLRRELQQAGASVVGPVPTVERALALARSDRRIDVAFLDVNLHGEKVYPVADVLAARRVPLVFTTAYHDAELLIRFPGSVRCAKPFRFRDLERVAAAMLG